MLQNLSEQIKYCYERAAEARRRAEEAGDPDAKADFNAMELGWLRLAESRAQSERVEQYLLDQGALQNAWQPISSAPFDRHIELLVVINDTIPHALIFPCRRILGGWIEADAKERLDVQPIGWREWT
jgi:hypothetical protein